MKLLLVLGSDDTCRQISSHAAAWDFEIIRYTHVLKAMDNIDEIDPQAIIISAQDFPRHWKIMAMFARNQRPDACPLIVLKGDNFPVEEASKAFFLGISGIIDENLEDSADLGQLKEILNRQAPEREKPRPRKISAEPWHRLGFVFIHPQNNVLVTGMIKDISSGGFSFAPDDTSLSGGMIEDTELAECSLRAGDSVLSPVCRVSQTGQVISLVFFSFPEGEQEVLTRYMENLPAAETKR